MTRKNTKKVDWRYEYELLPTEKKIITASKIQLPAKDEGCDESHISCSQICMYLRCPMQYYFRYILGLKEPPAVAIIEGSCHHTANEKNNLHKLKTGKDYPVKHQQQLFGDVFSKESKQIKKWEGEKKDSVIKRGKKIQEDYIKTIAPRIIPELVEDYIEIKLGPVKIIGYMDVSGKIKHIVRKQFMKMAIDYKVTGKMKSEDQLIQDLQLSLYGWQNAEKHGGVAKFGEHHVGFCIMNKKNQQVGVQLVPFDNNRVKWFRYMALYVSNAISLGAFPPCDSANNFLCQEKYCGYWKRCKGKVFKY